MVNFKKIKEAVTKLTSILLTATLSVGMFSATPIKAMRGFLNTQIVKEGRSQIIDMINLLSERFAMTGPLNKQIVEAYEPYIQKYWDPYTMLSLAGFILGEDKKGEIEKLKKEFEKELKKEFEKELNTNLSNEKCGPLVFEERKKWVLETANSLAENCLKSRLEDKLDEEGKKVYDAVKEFITAKELECQFVRVGNKNETTKAIIVASVPNDSTLGNFQMERIIGDIKGLKIEGVEKNDFKNVYLVIRPEENGEKFSINYDIMENLQNATIVTSGAKFDENVTISENSTLIANGAFFGKNVDVKVTVGKGGNLTANGATFYGNIPVEVGGNLTANGARFVENVTVKEDGKLTANGATFYREVTAVEKGGKLTANGVYFGENVTVKGNLTANGACFVENVTVEKGGKLTANGAFFGKNVDVKVTVEKGGKLNADGAEFCKDVTVKGELTANGAKFRRVVNVKSNNLTVDISNANFESVSSCVINANNSKINLTGCNFEKIEFESGCKNLIITVSDNKVDKFYQEYKDLDPDVFKSINKVTWEEIINLNSQCQNDSENFLNEFKNLKQKKEEAERLKREKEEKDITNNNNGKNNDDNTTANDNNEINNIIFKEEGFIKKHPVISCTIGTLLTGIVVTPLVVFRNKIIKGIESIFGKNQNKKPTAKRIKATN